MNDELKFVYFTDYKKLKTIKIKTKENAKKNLNIWVDIAIIFRFKIIVNLLSNI